jgi:ATP-binding cassette, subfamily F, member 3
MAPSSANSTPKNASNWLRKTRPLKRELEQNEERMASIDAEKNRLEALLTTPVSPSEMADAGRRLKALSDEVATLEDRWLALTALLEEAETTL